MRRRRLKQLRPEEVLEGVLDVLRIRCPRIRVDSWSPLTRPLLEHFRTLGRQCGFEAWDSKGGGAYLWDVVWESRPTARRYWLELVGEVELSDPNLDEIQTDFYKVLDAKARLKVFVSAPPSRLLMAKLRKGIDWAVRHQVYRLKEERLIAVLLAYDGRRDEYLAQARLYDGRGPVGAWKRDWKTVVLAG